MRYASYSPVCSRTFDAGKGRERGEIRVASGRRRPEGRRLVVEGGEFWECCGSANGGPAIIEVSMSADRKRFM